MITIIDVLLFHKAHRIKGLEQRQVNKESGYVDYCDSDIAL